jgi:hypothetical protein
MSLSIHRFKFTDEIVDMINEFAKVHQYDERKTYKETWKVWFNNNKDVLDKELDRLMRIGYSGDVEDKMFKAGRYYFRKKKVIENVINENVINTDTKQLVKKRRDYITMDNSVIVAMDQHIKLSFNTNTNKKKKLTPASGFDNFCKTHIAVLQEEIKRLCNLNTINSEDLSIKIKKTYKNRYFIFSQSV